PGVTFLWPTFCDNLFPCHEDPDDGSTFTLVATGVADGLTAVAPARIPVEVPSYVPAVAVGAYAEIALGVTPAGTAVSVHHLPGEEAAAAAGPGHLVAVVGFLEAPLGPYRFGDALASVSVPWGPGAYGGMEHHPFVHVASAALASEEVHAHEAAHGWFGDGVR